MFFNEEFVVFVYFDVNINTSAIWQKERKKYTYTHIVMDLITILEKTVSPGIHISI